MPPKKKSPEGSKESGSSPRRKRKKVPRHAFDRSLIPVDNENLILACGDLSTHDDQRVRSSAIWIGALFATKIPEPTDLGGVEELESQKRVLKIMKDVMRAHYVVEAARKMYEGKIHQLTLEEVAAGNTHAPFTTLLWPAYLRRIQDMFSSDQPLQDLVVEFVRTYPTIKDSYGRAVACFREIEDEGGSVLRLATHKEIVAAIQKALPGKSSGLTENIISKALTRAPQSEDKARKEILRRAQVFGAFLSWDSRGIPNDSPEGERLS